VNGESTADVRYDVIVASFGSGINVYLRFIRRNKTFKSLKVGRVVDL